MQQAVAEAPSGAFSSARARQGFGARFALIALALLLALPLLVVFSSLLTPETEIWRHLVEFVLPDLLLNTFRLVAGVAIGTVLIGVSLAWLTALYDFPGRAFFSWALLLPLAMPAYVAAFVFIGLLDFSGPVQTGLRQAAVNFRLPEIRSAGGVIVVMTLVFYPYVYLLARNAFLTQGRRTLETAQSLGLSRMQAFFHAALPMARPWIAGGLALVLMETLADFGTVAAFNYDTFTTAIYKTWFGLFSLSAAAQLSSVLMVIILAIVLLEQRLRSRHRYHVRTGGEQRIPLTGAQALGAFFYASLVFAVAFVVPLIQLFVWASEDGALDFRAWPYLWRSLTLAGMATVVTGTVALLLAYAVRRRPGLMARVALRFATFGYAVPGAVLAVGIFIPVAWLDSQLSGFLGSAFGIEAGHVLQGTLLVMLLAYLMRFLAVNFGPVEAAMLRITQSTEEAARSLGLDAKRVLMRVHLPLLKGGLFTGALLVFVDVMKEMPITLMTRPFGWDTLATRIFELTSEGQWQQAAAPALALVVAGLVPIVWLSRRAEES
jgi:iron(III) transport system permease protein